MLDLKWTKHVDIMVNCAQSTIHRISILRNSIRGLNFMNWRRVYNALVIPTLTYGAQVWYTRHRQKGLTNRMQIAQNEGLHKLMGVFKTTPIEPLHNLTRIPLIPYLIGKLMHSYALRIRALPPNTKVRTILSHDQCRYWPDYIQPLTNLSRAIAFLGDTIPHRAPTDGTPKAWAHPLLHHLPSPPPHVITQHKESMAHQEAADSHILLYYTRRELTHLAFYFICRRNTTLKKGAI
jgi:hypothetical protein